MSHTQRQESDGAGQPRHAYLRSTAQRQQAHAHEQYAEEEEDRLQLGAHEAQSAQLGGDEEEE